MKFAGKPKLRHNDGTETVFEPTYVAEGTTPAGSVWAMNPIPDYGSDHGAPSFAPRCHEVPGCCRGGGCMDNKCRCSGEWGPYDLEIVDVLAVPPHLPAGDYVLGWRWDCEESNQVWSSCSDITIKVRGA